MPTTDRLLYESPPPGKIRALTWFAAAVLAACIPASVFVFQSTIRNSHSPELAPLSWRLALAGAVAGSGAVFFFGMLFYLRFYTTHLYEIVDTDHVRVETLRLFGRHERTLAATQIATASFHHGEWDSLWSPSVRAPWFWISVVGGRGFLLDVQGEFFDSEALDRLLSLHKARRIGDDGAKRDD